MKNRGIAAFGLTVLFVIGLGLLLYPRASNYWNSLHSTKEVNQYAAQVEGLDEEYYADLMLKAEKYNLELTRRENAYKLSPEQEKEYMDLLDISDNGVMGYIEIPVIGVTLPIYHGTSNAVLQKAIGHLDWTSLPIGGPGSHCVLSGHRGLPSAKLFTDLDKVAEGDVFIIRVLNEVLTYKVDRILTVEPADTSSLTIEANKDYCTLVTCTPYAVNTHRLLVRGHRIDNTQLASVAYITADAVQIEPLIVAPVIFTFVLTVIVIVNALLPSRRNRRS